MTLRDLRKQHGLTDIELAQRVGVTRDGIRKVESGCGTTTGTLQRIAYALGIDFLSVARAWESSKKPSSSIDTQYTGAIQ